MLRVMSVQSAGFQVTVATRGSLVNVVCVFRIGKGSEEGSPSLGL